MSALTVIPNTIESKVNPPPKKSEIIAAMVAIRMEELTQKAIADHEKYKSESELIRNEVWKYWKKADRDSATIDLGWREHNGQVSGIEITANVTPHLPDDLKKRIAALYKLPAHLREPDAKTVRKEIMDAMQGSRSARVEQLVSDKDSSDALKKMLKEIFE